MNSRVSGQYSHAIQTSPQKLLGQVLGYFKRSLKAVSHYSFLITNHRFLNFYSALPCLKPMLLFSCLRWALCGYHGSLICLV